MSKNRKPKNEEAAAVKDDALSCQVVFRRKSEVGGVVYVDGYFKSPQKHGDIEIEPTDGTVISVKVADNGINFSGKLVSGNVELNLVYGF